MASIREGDDNLSSFTDRKDFNTYLSVFPFSELKNKWIQGFMVEFGAWFCNIDQRQQAVNGCSRLRIQDKVMRPGRRCLIRMPNSIGEGLATLISPGITWEIGPYRIRAMGAFLQAADGNFTPPPDGGAVALRGKKRANNFLIGHDLFLWSPKGWLTGSVNTPGSMYTGTHFERNNVSCEIPRCNPAINGGQFHRGVYVVREWDLWYTSSRRE